MGYRSDHDIGRSVLRRVEVVEVDDTGPIQKVTVMGLADEYFELPLRGQPHGLTTVPAVGSVGYAMMANGRPDQAFLMGLEHPDQRFKAREPGETTLYAEKRQEVFFDKDGNAFIRAPQGNMDMTLSGEMKVQPGGDMKINTGGTLYINC